MKIFFNGKIFAPDYPLASAVAIDRGFFIALGTDDELLQGFTHVEQKINLQRRTLWPGLTDAHVHLRHLADSMAMVDCETATLQECLARVKAATHQLPHHAWVRGHGWNHNRWEAGYGTSGMLDTVCEDRPAYLTAKSLHAAWANSKALALAGINADTPDPSGGKIQRDHTGQPTGILFEAEAMALVESIIPKPSQEEITAKINALIPKLWQMGLIGVHDFDGMDCWNALQMLQQNKDLQFRVRKNIPFEHLDTFIKAGLRTDYGDDNLHVGGVKLFADGALGPQTAAMHQPYEGSDDSGQLLLSEKEIFEIGKEAVNHGIALTVHAIGDLANQIVLNAFTHLRNYEQQQGLSHFYHRIEHVQIIEPEDIARLSELDIVASVQPIHAPSDMLMADKNLGERAKNAYAYGEISSSGAVVVLGSDAPVEPVNPFMGIHAAVTRRREDGSPGVDGWQPDQRLSLSQAIWGYSQTPAQISNRGTQLGRISPGYKADFIILNNDPFALDPHELRSITPAATFVDGICVFQSPSLSLDIV